MTAQKAVHNRQSETRSTPTFAPHVHFLTMDKPTKLKKKARKEQKEKPAPSAAEPVVEEAAVEAVPKTFPELVRRPP